MSFGPLEKCKPAQCPHCGYEADTEMFSDGDRTEGIPAYICINCGEIYLEDSAGNPYPMPEVDKFTFLAGVGGQKIMDMIDIIKQRRSNSHE